MLGAIESFLKVLIALMVIGFVIKLVNVILSGSWSAINHIVSGVVIA